MHPLFRSFGHCARVPVPVLVLPCALRKTLTREQRRADTRTATRGPGRGGAGSLSLLTRSHLASRLATVLHVVQGRQARVPCATQALHTDRPTALDPGTRRPTRGAPHLVAVTASSRRPPRPAPRCPQGRLGPGGDRRRAPRRDRAPPPRGQPRHARRPRRAQRWPARGARAVVRPGHHRARRGLADAQRRQPPLVRSTFSSTSSRSTRRPAHLADSMPFLQSAATATMRRRGGRARSSRRARRRPGHVHGRRSDQDGASLSLPRALPRSVANPVFSRSDPSSSPSSSARRRPDRARRRPSPLAPSPCPPCPTRPSRPPSRRRP